MSYPRVTQIGLQLLPSKLGTEVGRKGQLALLRRTLNQGDKESRADEDEVDRIKARRLKWEKARNKLLSQIATVENWTKKEEGEGEEK